MQHPESIPLLEKRNGKKQKSTECAQFGSIQTKDEEFQPEKKEEKQEEAEKEEEKKETGVNQENIKHEGYGLALSGGGLRAMIVTLGVLSFLYDEVKTNINIGPISAVSGSTYALSAILSHLCAKNRSGHGKKKALKEAIDETIVKARKNCSYFANVYEFILLPILHGTIYSVPIILGIMLRMSSLLLSTCSCGSNIYCGSFELFSPENYLHFSFAVCPNFTLLFENFDLLPNDSWKYLFSTTVLIFILISVVGFVAFVGYTAFIFVIPYCISEIPIKNSDRCCDPSCTCCWNCDIVKSIIIS